MQEELSKHLLGEGGHLLDTELLQETIAARKTTVRVAMETRGFTAALLCGSPPQ